MKAILIISMAVCLMIGCKKDNSVYAKYDGRWEVRRAYGGLSYRDSVYAPGNGNIYQFNADNTYKHFTSGEQDGQGVFKIKATANRVDISTDVIYFDNETNGNPISLTGAKLTLGTIVGDGIAVEYEKSGN